MKIITVNESINKQQSNFQNINKQKNTLWDEFFMVNWRKQKFVNQEVNINQVFNLYHELNLVYKHV